MVARTTSDIRSESKKPPVNGGNATPRNAARLWLFRTPSAGLGSVRTADVALQRRTGANSWPALAAYASTAGRPRREALTISCRYRRAAKTTATTSSRPVGDAIRSSESRTQKNGFVASMVTRDSPTCARSCSNNAAVIAGWRLLRVTPSQLFDADTIAMIAEALLYPYPEAPNV